MKKVFTILIFIVTIVSFYLFTKSNNNDNLIVTQNQIDEVWDEEISQEEIDKKTTEVKWNDDSEIIQIKNTYTADIILDDVSKSYSMDLIVDVINDSEDVWNEIFFRDYPSAFTDRENGKLSEITDVVNAKSNKKLELVKNEDKTVFSVKLNQPLQPGKAISIKMKYKAYIPNLDARYGYRLTGDQSQDFYLANCIPILCPYDNGKFQYYPYFEVGECFYSRMANYDVKITVPSKYTVIATGDLEDEIPNEDDTITYMYTAKPVRDYAIMIGDSYVKNTKEVDGINVSTYFHRGHEREGIEALNIAISTVKSMNKRLGQYPYNNLSVVELEMSMMGMEYPQIVLVTHEESGVGASIHEIIHQWFYSLVGNNCYVDPWVDESITTYLANPGLDEDEGIVTQAYSDFDNDNDYGYNIYFCGAALYNRLEEKYGKEKINAFMNELLEKYAYKEIDTQTLVDLLKVYYGEDNSVLKTYISEKYLQDHVESDE